MIFSILSGAYAPGLALLSFIYLKDRYQLEPLRIIVKLFILGSIIVFPVYVIERMFEEGLSPYFWYSDIFTIAVIEEFLKWFVVYFMIYKHLEFDEPYDGVVYAASVSIGFASIENFGYLFFQSHEASVILFRGLLPVSSHAVYGIIMGYFIGRAKFSVRREKLFLILSFILPIFTHYLYNLILNQHFTNWVYLMLPFKIVIWVYSLNKIKIASKLSPFREEMN